MIDAAPSVRIQVLGGFGVWVAGKPVPHAVWRQRRAAAVVKILALERGHRLHRDQVMETLWPDLDADAAANNLRGALLIARRALEAAGAPPGLFLVRDGEMLSLGPTDRLDIDVDRFQAAASRAWHGHTIPPVQQAVEAWGGDLLPDDPYEDWAVARREGLRASFLTLLERLARLHEAAGDGYAALAARDQALRIDPLDEAQHVGVLRLLGATGQRQRALAHYADLERLLATELGAEPEPATQALIAAIRAGTAPPALVSPPAISHAGTTPSSTLRPLSISASARLPAAVDGLVGRKRELADLAHLLSRARLVSLTGPGGTGKTRLAQELGRQWVTREGTECAFVDLAPLQEATLVVPAVARALGLEESPSRLVTEVVAEAIAERHLLLILDNMEQVSAAAPEVGALLRACPHLTILSTSRVRLRLRGEQEYPVAPLAVPELPSPGDAENLAAIPLAPSVELFRQRAEAARPDFALTPGVLPAVAAICRRLDGLPLAIELAAARIRMLPPAQLQQRLERPLDDLSTTDWDVPDRHRTLRATMAWSYDLLNPQEQDMFRQMSAFRGSWSLAAFATVANTQPEHLASLIDHSLVFAQRSPDDEESRFAMLQTIRDFAEERLIAAGEQEVTLRRHAEVFLALAEEAAPHLEGSAQAEWLQRLERDHPNLTAALHWLRLHDPALALRLGGALWRFWWLLGLLTEGAQELDQLQTLSVPDDPVSMARVHDGAGVLAESRSDYQRAAQCYEAAAASWREAGDERGLARALLHLGTVTAFQGERDLAATYHREGLQRLRALGDKRGVAVALTSLGLGHFLAGECEAAVQYDQEGLLIWRELGDPQGLALALDNLGEAELCNGNPEAAHDCHEEALRIQRDIGAKRGVASALINLGITARVQNTLALAEVQLAEGLHLAQTVGDLDAVSRALDALAGLASDQGRFHDAAQLHGAAASLRKTHGIDMPPVYRPGYESDLASARNHLGEAFAPAWEAGAALGFSVVEAPPAN